MSLIFALAILVRHFTTGYYWWVQNVFYEVNMYTVGVCDSCVHSLMSWSSVCLISEQRTKTKVEQLEPLPQLSKPHFTGGGFRIDNPVRR